MENKEQLNFEFLSGFWSTNIKDREEGIILAIHYKIRRPDESWAYNCKICITDKINGRIEVTYNPEGCVYSESEAILRFNYSEPCYFAKGLNNNSIIFGYKDPLNKDKEWEAIFHLENRILTK